MMIATHTGSVRISALLAALAASVLLAACERPPVETVQTGYRGTGIVQVYNPRTLADQASRNALPAETPPAPADGPKAGTVYKNVQVLGDLSVGEFTRLMVSMTAWVAPEQGCTYCHKPGEDFSTDSVYTKIVSRRMLEMTANINANWKAHVADTGVTCYTCHRGNAVPQYVWSTAPKTRQEGRMLGDNAGQNIAAPAAGLSSLPYDPFTPYLSQNNEIRVIGATALPTGNRQSIKQGEHTYSLMMHMSQALGVNCTYCHNSRAFSRWEESSPQRTAAWYGIRMARELNNEYMDPLQKVFPVTRLGPAGDVLKVNCTTCHQGAYVPLYGAKHQASHPELGKVSIPVAKR
jgi:photosynthetic reaction center cytochrome c subunit